MSFAINTNIASLQAQEYLRTNSEFQAKTINRVTSGLRIISSGDDAAGLAIANTFRSDQSVLSQGIRNANDGLSQLQIADGGISNISKLLDRARTLATQSASGAFTGGTAGRTLLNSEFQSVVGEIDRQAKSIGLDQGGTFNTNLAVFIGGGRGANAAGVITNGSVSVDLSTSAVDSKSLGLQGYAFKTSVVDTTASTGFFDTYAGGAASPVNAVISFKGAGFSGANAVTVSANLTGVGDVNALAAAINAGIQGAAAGGTAQAAAFKNANIVASADSTGKIVFTSAKAFQVTDSGSAAGQVLLNNSAAAFYGYAQGTNRNTTTALTFATLAAGKDQDVTLEANNPDGSLVKINVNLAATTTLAQAVTAINSALQGSNQAALQSIVVVQDGAATIGFTSSKSFNLTIADSSDANATGFASGGSGTKTAGIVSGETGATASIDTIGGAQASVTALASAVTALGQAQANVGRGQNQFGYAINLASSQLTNLAAAESRIRDADLASEAANLTKASTLLQAGIAALAQANSAPQSVLSLLRG